ncbi:oxalurate catabolism protein HpxZ [Neorhizobium galegae]|uniref:oxalurate catabolism protein HpxZ n=1 Tax=Neorhizobium galegae TaxID=399 RepID=UPI001AE347FD|nr:oxalurate catabolism protein HpxZ [Neorhizobium galegae]
MEINHPETRAEVEEIFARYETALLANDNETLLSLFLDSPVTVRYGVSEVQHGFEEVKGFRAVQAPFTRKLERTVITTYGRDFATASTLFHRPDFPGAIGRQMQTWVRTPHGWKVAAAHVSMMPA